MGEEYGLNAVHVYLEGNSSTNPESVGINLNLADTLVALTKKLISISFLLLAVMEKMARFIHLKRHWIFGPCMLSVMKNETHLIFEAHNEPVAYTLNNFKKEDWDKQYKLYKHIRKLAPDTLILLGSFMSFFDPGGTPTWGFLFREKGSILG